MFKKLLRKTHEEDEEVVELTPEEKKAKVKKIAVSVGKTIGAMAAGAACVVTALIYAGKKTADETDEADKSIDSDDEVEEAETSLDSEE